ncbi:MAG: MutS-related protein [Acutalibacter sp.]
MEVLWIFLILLAVAALAGLVASWVSGQKRLRQRVLGQFGKLPPEDSSLEGIPKYASLLGDLPVDGATWEDLDMDRVFRRVNSCQSAVGEQVLYAQLHRLEQLPHWEELLAHLENCPDQREHAWLTLARVGKRRSCYSLAEFLFAPEEVSLLLGPLYPLFALLPLAGLVGMLWNYWVGGCVLIGSLCWNVVLYYLGKRRVQGDLERLQALSSLLWACRRLTKVLSFAPLREDLEEALVKFRPLEGRMTGLTPRGSADWELLQEYYHIFTLRDLRLYRRAVKLVKEYPNQAKSLYQAAGMVDAAIAVLSFRRTLPQWCRPTYHQENVLEFAGLFHPLLQDPVENSGRLEKDVLLTGSNASGKSTFLKALAVNAILGQSIDTCAGERYVFRPGRVLSSMAVRDDITAGESYFMAEVRSLKRLTDAARTGGCLLFIDEILKGTNTVERLAASQAVLEELHRRDCLCVAATHDLELTSRLAESYHSFHFQERLTGEGVEFDYLLRPGPANTQNAIRLLQVLGFSASTVERAQELAKRGEIPT